MNTLILTCGGRGGTGKTTSMVAFADMLQAKGQKFAVIDCDTENANKISSFSHWFGGKANALDLRDVADCDRLLQQTSTAGVPFVLADLPANSSADLSDWLVEVATPKTLRALNINMIAIGAVSASPGSPASIAHWMSVLGDRASYVITLNRTQFERRVRPRETTFAEWFSWLQQNGDKVPLATIEIPHLHEHTKLALLSLGKLPSRAVKDPQLDVLARFRIETWIERVHAQLEATGLFGPQSVERLTSRAK
jgi:CobQ/CobB/MinD/ParA family nucleotide binding protein